MIKILFVSLVLVFCIPGICQQKEEAEKLVDEGIAYHDKGDYEGAISRYDKALVLDKDNLLALTEKAFSLLYFQKPEESIKCCQRAIETHPGENLLKNAYVTYGNALDALKKTDESIAKYDEGIQLFPDYFQLHFNKGISLASVRKYDESLSCFQQAASLNPEHGSSHNAIARISLTQKRKIPALLAYCRFLAIEPESNRAKENLASLQTIMGGGAKKTGANDVTINLSPDALSNGKKSKGSKENDFSTAELILTFDAALDYDEKNKDKTVVEQFIRKFDNLCGSLKEGEKEGLGFYWKYYVPYFTEMQDKKLIEAFSYLAFSSSEDPTVTNWIKTHGEDINKFMDWSKSFSWKTN